MELTGKRLKEEAFDLAKLEAEKLAKASADAANEPGDVLTARAEAETEAAH